MKRSAFTTLIPEARLEAVERALKTTFNTMSVESIESLQTRPVFLMRQVCLMFYAMGFMRFATALQSKDSVIDDRIEAVRHRDFAMQIASGTVLIASAEGQFLYAKVLLNEALYNMKTPRFAESIRRMIP